MGSGSQPVKVIYDTGSDWLIVGTQECTTCKGSPYDYSTSTQFQKGLDSNTETFVYGSAIMEGFKASDLVCVLPNLETCTGMQWFASTLQTGLGDNSNGIVGLSTGSNAYAHGPLLIEELYKAGSIEQAVFAIYLGGLDQSTYLDIGGFHNESMKNAEE